MARVPLDISNGFYESFSKPLANQQCVNLYPVVPETPARSQTAIRQTPGIDSFGTVSDLIGRGRDKIGETPFFVIGNSLYETASSGASINRGTIAGTGPVSMANDGTLIWIVVPGAQSYHFDTTTNTLTLNTDPNFLGPATSVSFKDGFFVFTTDDIIFNSNLDGTTFTPTDFGTAEIDPDKIFTSLVIHNQLMIPGTEIIEVFQTVGGAGFPFQRVSGAQIDKGLSARFAIVQADNTFFWMGGSNNELPSIYRAQGANSIKVSTPAIDRLIQSHTDAEIQDVTAWAYSQDGEEFIGFKFPATTIVFQVVASSRKGRPIWHERKTVGTTWRINFIQEAFGKLLTVDDQSGEIGRMDSNLFTEFSATPNRQFSTEPFNQDGLPLFASKYELIMETGVGNASSTAPVVNSSFSDNSVNFFQMLPRSIGGIGEFNTRVLWRRMGRIPRQRVLSFQVKEPCKIAFYRIEADLDDDPNG